MNYIEYLLALILFFFNVVIVAQVSECYVIDDVLEYGLSRSSSNISEEKTVVVNVHFIQDDNGDGNFTPNGDGFGNILNGYEVAQDLVNIVNNRPNEQLNIPPNNGIQVLSTNIILLSTRCFFIKIRMFILIILVRIHVILGMVVIQIT